MRPFFTRAQELCESGGGRPGLPSLISLTVSGRKATLNQLGFRAQELCESGGGGGRPGLPSLISLMVYVDVKQHFSFNVFFTRRTSGHGLT